MNLARLYNNNHYIWGLVRGERERERTEMMTTDALRVQMDNLRRELQLLQVENKKLQEQRGDEQSSGVREEMEDLR